MNPQRTGQNHAAIPRVDYDRIAPSYDRRYDNSPMDGVADALQSLTRKLKAKRVLEVGCGTGRYLDNLGSMRIQRCGLDLSAGMLAEARRRGGGLDLVRGRASMMPFPVAAFNLVFCVNALHHFSDPKGFVGEAHRSLRPGGVLAVVGSDPHDGHDAWYVYDYFAGTLHTDLLRFPPSDDIKGWMMATGFADVERHWVERIVDSKLGRDVLNDPFLKKDACSQLALLSDEAYAAGLQGIEEALKEAEAAGETLVFPVDIHIGAIIGTRTE